MTRPQNNTRWIKIIIKKNTKWVPLKWQGSTEFCGLVSVVWWSSRNYLKNYLTKGGGNPTCVPAAPCTRKQSLQEARWQFSQLPIMFQNGRRIPFQDKAVFSYSDSRTAPGQDPTGTAGEGKCIPLCSWLLYWIYVKLHSESDNNLWRLWNTLPVRKGSCRKQSDGLLGVVWWWPWDACWLPDPDGPHPEACHGLAAGHHQLPIQTGAAGVRPEATPYHRKIPPQNPGLSGELSACCGPRQLHPLSRQGTEQTEPSPSHSSGHLSCGRPRLIVARCKGGVCGYLEAAHLEQLVSSHSMRFASFICLTAPLQCHIKAGHSFTSSFTKLQCLSTIMAY